MTTMAPPALASRALIVLLAALVAFAPLSIDMYLPSLPALALDLAASETQVQHSISLFLVGLCIGMLFYGPLSDRFGRRPLLQGGIALYVAASLGCAMAASAEQLLLWRGLQALGGAAASVLARAMVRDLFSLQQSARVLSLMHLVTMLATLVAPLLGSYLMELAGWRSIFIGLLGFVSVTGMLGTNAIASLMALFPQRAGAASALAVAGQFGLGALASAAVGALHDGSPRPMCLVVALCGAGAFVALRLALRGEPALASS